MSTVVNLRRARKGRARARKAAEATARAARHGRGKAEAAAERDAAARADRLLDQHRLDPPDGGGASGDGPSDGRPR
jgi:hypothetical protein